MSTLTRMLLALTVSGLLVSGPAAAADRKKVAVLPMTTKGRVDGNLVEQVQRLLDAGPSTSIELVAVSGKLLARALDGAPQKVVAKCEHAKRFDQCLSKVALQLGVEEVLVSRLSSLPSGLRLQVLSFSASGKVEQRFDAQGLSAGKLRAALDGPTLAKVFNVPYLDPDAPPPEPPAPAPQEPSSPVVLAPPPTGAPSIVVAPPPYAVNTAPPPPSRRAKSASLLWWGGWLLTAAGAGTIGAGAYFGAESLKGATATPTTSLTQRQAMGRYDTADEQAVLANTLFAVGGGVALAGVVCIIVDLVTN